MTTIRVRAVPGALVPHPSGRRREFVGYRAARAGETPDHRFGRTSAGLVLAGDVEVQKTPTIERAIRRAELVEVLAQGEPAVEVIEEIDVTAESAAETEA